MANKTVSALIGHDGITRRVEYTVPDTEPDFWGADHDFSIIGKKRTPRPDAIEKVTGKAKYTYDVNRPNMLYAVMVTCPHANANVLNIDTSEAEAMPGVKAVMTSPSANKARYAGWLIAAVAAETIQQARDAARKVKANYEIQPFVVEDQATGPRVNAAGLSAVVQDSPSVYREGRFEQAIPMNRGNVDTGFAQADVIHEAEYETQVTPHCCAETHGCVAEWDGDDLTVWYSTQGIWNAQRAVARAGGILTSRARVITQHMGGGFGSKITSDDAFCGMCVQLAKETGRPVKFMANRYEDIVTCGNKPGCKMSVKVGAKRDGTLTAIDVSARNIVGYTGSESVGGPFHDNYNIPNVRVGESNVLVNAGASRPFRAPGKPQGTFGLEMAIEELAMKLDMDSLELRRKNVSSSELDARIYELQIGAEQFGWKEKFRKHGSDPGPVKHGVGCATTFWPYYSSAGGATVRCTIFPDGSVEVANASQDLGTGTRTMMAVVAAETLGINVELIKVLIGDTQLGLVGPDSSGSKTVAHVAPALRSAAYQAQRQLFEIVAAKWGTTADHLDCKDGIVFLKNDPTGTMTWAEAASMIPADPIVATAKNRSAPTVRGVPIGTAMRGAQFAEVEVDTETGKVRCTKVVAVQDCGKAMAKTQAENQICGGVIMGVSYALSENRIMDNITGRQVNPNMEDYKILGPLEAPDIEVVLVDVFDPANNASAKGLAEPPHIPTAAAIGCAVFNALGIPIRTLPITPYKVLEAVKRMEG
jgi:xanthine dehydrogenase YagR molybdenum-binding subunit